MYIIKFNADKFFENNLLFITGISGSGKSTLAYDIADKIDADVISLDFYYDNLDFQEHADLMCDRFNKYLEEHLPEIFDIEDNFEYYEEERFHADNGSEAGIFYWKVMDMFSELIKDFAKQNPLPVIVEGLQIYDSTIPNNLEYFKDQALYVIYEDVDKCAERVIDRDGLTVSKDDIIRKLTHQSNILDRFIERLKNKIKGE